MNMERQQNTLERLRNAAARADRLQARAIGIVARAARLDPDLTDWTEQEQRAKAIERALAAVENEATAWEARLTALGR